MSFDDTTCKDTRVSAAGSNRRFSDHLFADWKGSNGKGSNRMEQYRLQRRLFGPAMALCLMLGLMAQPALANPADEPSGVEMVGDVIIARPVGLAMTAIGTAAFVVSLPLSALGGNIGEAAEKLVVDPARETFVRCLGCRNTGRYRRPKD